METLVRWPSAGDREVLNDLAGKPGRGSAGLALEEEAEAASPFPRQRRGVPRARRRGRRAAPGAGGGSRPEGGLALQPPRPSPLWWGLRSA